MNVQSLHGTDRDKPKIQTQTQIQVSPMSQCLYVGGFFCNKEVKKKKKKKKRKKKSKQIQRARLEKSKEN